MSSEELLFSYVVVVAAKVILTALLFVALNFDVGLIFSASSGSIGAHDGNRIGYSINMLNLSAHGAN